MFVKDLLRLAARRARPRFLPRFQLSEIPHHTFSSSNCSVFAVGGFYSSLDRCGVISRDCRLVAHMKGREIDPTTTINL
jgi:hypothetical protein